MSQYLNADGLAYVYENLIHFSYLPGGAAAHNSIYRGKDITGSIRSGDMLLQIASGEFNDIFIGDYFTLPIHMYTGSISSSQVSYSADVETTNVNFIVAGLNTYINCHSLVTNHIVIVPEENIAVGPLNATNSASSYLNLDIVTNNSLETILDEVPSSFDALVGNSLDDYTDLNYTFEHSYYLSNGNILPSTSGTWDTWDGCLLNSLEVLGYNYYSVKSIDIGEEKTQLPAFAFNSKLINTGQSYWMRDVDSSTSYAMISNDGFIASNSVNSTTVGIRPKFVLSSDSAQR